MIWIFTCLKSSFLFRAFAKRTKEKTHCLDVIYQKKRRAIQKKNIYSLFVAKNKKTNGKLYFIFLWEETPINKKLHEFLKEFFLFFFSSDTLKQRKTNANAKRYL